jgi:hypothetical protein
MAYAICFNHALFGITILQTRIFADTFTFGAFALRAAIPKITWSEHPFNLDGL